MMRGVSASGLGTNGDRQLIGGTRPQRTGCLELDPLLLSDAVCGRHIEGRGR